ncbi:MAG: LytR/AlgR family response regulator transcription factor [Gemmiger sp.]
MLQIAVVEDDAPTREKLCALIRNYAKAKSKELEVTPMADGSAFAAGRLTGFDIVFLDIMLPGANGMEVAECIRTADADVVIVFITNMAQYAIKGYSVGALDFVLKPINPYEFSVKLERAIDRAAQRKKRSITLQTADGVQILSSGDIFYVETRDRKLFYHTARGCFAVRGSMQNAEAMLAPLHFARCNQCYLVNLRHVQSVQGDFVTVGNDRLEISRRQHAAFLEAMMDYVGD